MPVRGDLESARLNRHQVQVEILGPGVEQELLDHHLGSFVLPLAEVVEAQTTRRASAMCTAGQ